MLLVGAQNIPLESGIRVVFDNPVSTFLITGIDPGSDLNPANPAAFPTFIQTTTGFDILIRQRSIVENQDGDLFLDDFEAYAAKC